MTEATTRTRAADPIDRYAAAFEALERGLNGASASPLHGLRRSAFEAFRRLGFPTPRDEAWKRVDLSPITRTAFAIPEGDAPGMSLASSSRYLFGGLEGTLLVFVDGRHDPALSAPGPLPGGVTATSLAGALSAGDERVVGHLARHADFDTHAFTALNTAFLRDGAFVHVPRGVRVERPHDADLHGVGRHGAGALLGQHRLPVGAPLQPQPS